MAVRQLSKSTIAQGLPRGSKFWDGISYDGSFDSIQTISIGTSTVSSVTFSSIPQTYKHLQIRQLNFSTTTLGADLKVQFNNDTGANYTAHILSGNGASASVSSYTSLSYVYGGGTGNNTAGWMSIIDILDYTNTNKNKTVRTFTGADANGSGFVQMLSGAWYNTNAISTITISPAAGAFYQVSLFALYGIKG